LAFSLVNFRGRLLEEMRLAGHEVVAVAPDDDPRVRAKLAEIGVRFRTVSMARTGINVFADIGTIHALVSLLRTERPDAVVAYTQKPIIYGGIACRIAGIDRFYALMSGLGYLFSEAASNRRLLRRIFCQLYRAGLKRARRIFVFNSDDRADMIAAGIVNPDAPVVEVPGSGVDLDRFQRAPLPEGAIHFLMIGRLMRDKGVWEYAQAAAMIAAHHPAVRFSLIGRVEQSNPTGLEEADLARLKQESPVDVIDETDDIPAYLARSHVFVLPTYYREGLPRTILEALAVGRPVITTDTPGCRDAVRQSENGFLVPPRDAGALAEAMRTLISNRELIQQMSQKSRLLAETVYDVRKVNALLMKEMGLRGPCRTASDSEVSSAGHTLRAAPQTPRAV
jgi:glycosyltransferase involved in cell wall biosynthesis